MKLPKDDPRRATIATEVSQVAGGMVETKKSIADFGGRVAKFTAAIADYNARHGTDARDAAREAAENARDANRGAHGTPGCADGH
jgi:hypothetical protein